MIVHLTVLSRHKNQKLWSCTQAPKPPFLICPDVPNHTSLGTTRTDLSRLCASLSVAKSGKCTADPKCFTYRPPKPQAKLQAHNFLERFLQTPLEPNPKYNFRDSSNKLLLTNKALFRMSYLKYWELANFVTREQATFLATTQRSCLLVFLLFLHDTSFTDQFR